MPPLRLLTWNIQNLGRKKQGFHDIVGAIAQVVTEIRPDIFIVMEINTTATDIAHGIGETIQAALKAKAGEGTAEWATYAVSPPTGVEFYGFFIRDDRVVRPVVPMSIEGPIIGIVEEGFVTWRNPDACVFPLIEPDLAQLHHHHPPRWTGARLPCLAMFRFDGRYLPVVTGHFAANETQAAAQIEMLPCFDLLSGVCNAGPPPEMTLDGRNVHVGHLVVAGDFNLHLDPSLYAGGMAVPTEADWGEPGALSEHVAGGAERAPGGKGGLGYAAVMGLKKTRRSVDMRAVIGRPTHLALMGEYSPRTMHETADLAVRCLDNFLVSTSIRVERQAVLDVPRMFRRADDPLTLPDAVAYYAANGMRSFDDDPTAPVHENYAEQLLGGSPTTMNLAAALAGARLISDHLPIVMDITLT